MGMTVINRLYFVILFSLLLVVGSESVAAGDLLAAPNSAVLGKFRYCFPAGTLIPTPNGNVPIEDLNDGDEIVSWDTENDSQAVGKIANTFTRFSRRLGHP